jgi:hypothetical protein
MNANFTWLVGRQYLNERKPEMDGPIHDEVVMFDNVGDYVPDLNHGPR